MRMGRLAVMVSLVGNILLFFTKLIFGLLFNSIALISEAINSFLDIFSTSVIYYCMDVSSKKADHGHPFGHFRAEPIASLIVAILIAVMGLEIMSDAVMRFFSGETIIQSYIPALIALIVLGTKSFLYIFTAASNKKDSMALKALAYDHRNDIFIAAFVLLSLAATWKGYFAFDNVAALVLSILIIYSSFKLGKDSIKYLMGESPSAAFMQKVKLELKKFKKVKGFHKLRAHYVGTVIHIQVNIMVDKNLSPKEMHDLGEKVTRKLESIKKVDKAFVHVDIA